MVFVLPFFFGNRSSLWPMSLKFYMICFSGGYFFSTQCSFNLESHLKLFSTGKISWNTLDFLSLLFGSLRDRYQAPWAIIIFSSVFPFRLIFWEISTLYPKLLFNYSGMLSYFLRTPFVLNLFLIDFYCMFSITTYPPNALFHLYPLVTTLFSVSILFFLLHPSSPASPSCQSAIYESVFVLLIRFHTWVKSYCLCPSLTGLFHLA